MREVGVHLHDQPGAACQRPPESGDVGRAEALLRGAVQNLDIVALPRRAGRRSRRCRRASCRRPPGSGAAGRQLAQAAATIGSRLSASSYVGSTSQSAAILGTACDAMPLAQNEMRNAEIADAFDGAGNALRARRSGPLPRPRLPGRREGDPPEPGVDRRADARRQGDRAARHRQDDARRRSSPCSRPASIPAADKLKAKFPATLVEVTRIPGLGAKTVRRLLRRARRGDLDDLREAAEDERIRDAEGPRRRRSRRTSLAALEKLGDEGPPERVLLSEVLPVAEQLAEVLREHPACDRVDGRRLGPAHGRDLQGHRHDRDRDRADRRSRGAGRARADRARPASRRRTASRIDHPQRDLGRPADRRARGLRQPAPALHGLGRAQRRRCASAR